MAFVATEAPKEMITAAEHKVNPLQPEGLPESEMNDAQKALLRRIILEYTERMRPELAAETLAEIEKTGGVHFGWAGGKERGEPHYYRVQGGNFVLEYDNTQNDANHVHSLWRDFDHDFGADLLKAHLDADHQGD